jgi:hypothetical protein
MLSVVPPAVPTAMEVMVLEELSLEGPRWAER